MAKQSKSPLPKVFISYAWKNQAIAKQLQRALQGGGVEVFVDYEEISGGDSLPARISAALDWCNTLILLWSADAASSYYVCQEWESAFHLQKRIIPCVLDNTTLPALLRGRLYLNFSSYPKGYAQLCRALGVESCEDITPNSAPAPQNPPPPQHADFKLEPSTIRKKSTQIVTEALAKPSSSLSLRSQPATLSPDQVKAMLKRYDFYCKDYDWSKSYCNPQGKGTDHNFELQQNGLIVFDRATGLTWQQSGSQDYMTYSQAENFVRQLKEERFAGFDDWRLPTLEEAMSLMEPKQQEGLYLDLKFDRTQRWIWTADKENAGLAWVVHFPYGHCYRHRVGSPNLYCVRAGRGGQLNI